MVFPTYDLADGEPAIVTEVYLPQKYARSPELQIALWNSLLPRQIRLHFEERDDETIKKFLPKKIRDDAEGYLRLKRGVIATGRSFTGYSIYDVAGAFRTTTMPYRILSDANACVRIIDRCLVEPGSIDRDLFERVTRTIFALRLHHDRLPDIQKITGVTIDIKSLVDRVRLWIDEGSFLLYGFLGYHLCDVTGGHEEQIWLTSRFEIVTRYLRLP